MSLMGLDIGTTGTKAVVFEHEGRILASAYREYPIHSPRPGWLELDPEEVWQLVAQAVAEAAHAVQASDPVSALAISCLGEAVVLVDDQGSIIAPTILGFDNRAEALTKRWLQDHDPFATMQITGMPPSQVFTIFKLMWLKENQPDVFRRARRVLCYQDYAIFRMGMEPQADYSIAARTMAFDIRAKSWSERIAAMTGVDVNLWSKAVPAGTVVGEIGGKAARALGLPRGCGIVAGAHDQPAGAVGCGVIREGLTMDATGTVECLGVALRKPLTNRAMLASHFCCYPHMVPDLYFSIAFNPTGGSLLRWFRDTLAGEERQRATAEGRDVYEILMEEMDEVPASGGAQGDLFVLPHFTMAGNPYMDPLAQGAIVGLSLTTTRGQLIRALLEGITYEMKLNLHLWQEAGIQATEIRAIGGGARSLRWLQLKADMFNRPVAQPAVTEAACLGAAIAAGVGTGVYSSFAEAVERLVRINQTFVPDRERAQLYEQNLEKYRRLYPLVRAFRTGSDG